MAMPEADIQATTLNGIVLLTGSVASPSDAEEAERLVQAFVGEGTQGHQPAPHGDAAAGDAAGANREVNRSFTRSLGVNLLSRESTGGFQFGIGQGNSPGTITPGAAGAPSTFQFTRIPGPGTAIGLAGRLFGLDLLSSIDLAENNGMATTLAQPSLTALSGETASFLAGGEFPIPISQSLGSVSIEYKSYGVGLAFTPTVLENGRISIRVRPEVPSFRRGQRSLQWLRRSCAHHAAGGDDGRARFRQSFMIGGLLRNVNNNTIDRAPGLEPADHRRAVPFDQLPPGRDGAGDHRHTLSRSAVNANQIALPTDGYRSANDGERMVLARSMPVGR